ncbi:MAG: hypothetical protein K5864_05275 [Bacteroidales bacterium]|nr:hypothetical protein [Bacteroidales bacterium]
MKRTLLLLFCGIILSVSAAAQTSVTVLEPHWSGAAKKTMIQQYTNDSLATICCYDGPDSLVFIYSSYNMQAKEAILRGYWVNDLVISDNIAYFCGKENTTQKGIIGYFDIHDVFFGSGQIYILSNLVVGRDENTVFELTRMTVFNPDNDNEHVACIGKCNHEENMCPCLIDFDADFSNPTYTGGFVNRTKEEFTDVKVVADGDGRDYLVTTGFDTENGRFINIRVYDPNDVFQPYGIQEMCHVYSMYLNDGRAWLDGGLLLRQLEKDNFVTVSYRDAVGYESLNTEYDEFPANLHLGFFKLSDIVNNSVYGLVRHYEIPLGNINAMNVNQVIYSSRKEKVVFLHTIRTLMRSTQSHFVEFDPNALTSTGTLQAYTDPGIRTEGLSLFNAETEYVLSGFIQSTPTTLKYEMETFNAIPRCVEKLDYIYAVQPEIASMNFPKSFDFVIKDKEPVLPEFTRIDLPLFIDCEQ